MNLYILVEGRSTERKVYPKMLTTFLEGQLQQVDRLTDVSNNHFFLLTANGYPRIFTTILGNTIQDINAINSFDYLVICIDTDEGSVADRKEELTRHLQRLKEQNIQLNDRCKIKLVAQNRCIETWFLGNKTVYKSNPQSEYLRRYQKFYNVSRNDPELLPVIAGFDTHAAFHFDYLREMLAARNIRYSKKHPRDVAELHYLQALVERSQKDGHLASFRDFYDFCKQLHTELVPHK
ncbi:MAG: hypothetical protein AAGJ82_08705 [Bacteroidota bacterium]